MHPLEILQRARSERLRALDETDAGEEIDEGPAELILLPPLDEAAIAALEERGGKLPAEVRKLLSFARGFALDAHEVDFASEETYPLAEPCVPRHRILADDGAGNSWIVETGGKAWGPVWFACHDPPSLVLQSATLSEFIDEVLNECRPGAKRRLVTGGVLAEPEDLPRVQDLRAGKVREAALEFPARTRVFEARHRAPGEGFPLRSVRATRLGAHPAFAIDRGGLAALLVRNACGWAALCGFVWVLERDVGTALAAGSLGFVIVRGYAFLLDWPPLERFGCAIMMLAWTGCCAWVWSINGDSLGWSLGFGTLGAFLLTVVAALLRRPRPDTDR